MTNTNHMTDTDREKLERAMNDELSYIVDHWMNAKNGDATMTNPTNIPVKATDHVYIIPDHASVATLSFAYAMESLFDLDAMTDAAGIGGGYADSYVALFDGTDIAAYIRVPFTSGRVSPAKWFDAVKDAASLYVDVPADAPMTQGHKFRANDGNVYRVKSSANGNPVARKFTRAKFLREYLCKVAAACVYTSNRVPNGTALNARGMRYRVIPVSDLDVTC